MSLSVAVNRIAAAQSLQLLFVGDALASPAHWYYDRSQLQADHGRIEGFVAPLEKMAGSILSLSSTSGGGRGRDDGDIIGKVINHGKKKYWGRGLDFHYHCTLQRAENTLEATIGLRVLLPHLATSGLRFERDAFLTAFETFMTTPGSHNDAYASTYLRQFFANRVKGVPLAQCADNDGHNTDAIDALTNVGPVVVASLLRDASDRAALHTSVEQFLRALRKSDHLPKFGRVFGDMLANLLTRDAGAADGGEALRAECVKAAKEVGFALEHAVKTKYAADNPMVACYIDGAFNALLVFAYKYADTPATALLESVNAGGENVARTSALGLLLGAAWGDGSSDASQLEQWKRELVFADEIAKALDALFSAKQSKL